MIIVLFIFVKMKLTYNLYRDAIIETKSMVELYVMCFVLYLNLSRKMTIQTRYLLEKLKTNLCIKFYSRKRKKTHHQKFKLKLTSYINLFSLVKLLLKHARVKLTVIKFVKSRFIIYSRELKNFRDVVFKLLTIVDFKEYLIECKQEHLPNTMFLSR